MGPKTTPSLISMGGYQIPPLGGREIDTHWEIGLSEWVAFEMEMMFNSALEEVGS